jgi:hypothetical protein
MELTELDEWAEEFAAFHSRFAWLFGRIDGHSVYQVVQLVAPNRYNVYCKGRLRLFRLC